MHPRLILAPGGILRLTFLHLGLGALAATHWALTGNAGWTYSYFRYFGAVFLITCAFVETRLAAAAFLEFEPKNPMRLAWLLFTLAGAVRLTSMVAAHLLAKDIYLNPWYLLSAQWDRERGAAVERAGLDMFGPASFVLLGAALLLTLHQTRKLGLFQRPSRFDLVLLALVGTYLVRQGYEFVYHATRTTTPLHFTWYLHWLTDPLLGLLLAIAILVHRASQKLKGGLIERCWSSYVAGIFLTVVADIGAWASLYSYILWPYNAVTWYLWFPPAAAFALGPAYQVEAIRRARIPASM